MEKHDFKAANRIPLIGRNSQLMAIEASANEPGVKIIYIEGNGGIGKTVLLQSAIDRLAKDKSYVVHNIIDLYHMEVQSPEGFIRKILDGFERSLVPRTRSLLKQLDKAREEGNERQIQKYLDQFEIEFLSEISELSVQQSIVLAIDTLETLIYTDVEKKQEYMLDVGIWINKVFLPSLSGDFVVLMAGRPSLWRHQLELLQSKPHVKVDHYLLSGLSKRESISYMKAVVNTYADSDAAARLRTFLIEQGGVLHFLTKGKPILLSLVADMIAQGWTLPQIFARSSDDLKAIPPDALHEKVQKSLVTRLQFSPSPIGETLRQLAWLRKGGTEELLARLLGLQKQNGTWDIERVRIYLTSIRTLTFIKTRPGDKRVFLHDELYELFERYSLSNYSPDECNKIYETINSYYEDQLNQLSSPQPFQVEAQVHRQKLLLEKLHYLLRQQPQIGFSEYFRLIEGAIGERNQTFEMLLRAELVRTTELLEISNLQDTQELKKQAQTDLIIRKGMQALFINNPRNFESALQYFKQAVENTQAAELELITIHAQLYEAVAYILRGYRSDYRTARQILAGLGERLMNYLDRKHQVIEHRAQLLNALLFNYRGYLDRQEGRYQEAIKSYQKSAVLQRRFRMTGLAPTLINLAYAQAYLGYLHEAGLSLDEAEQLVQKSNSQILFARALTTRAYVEMKGNNHGRALSLIEDALNYKDRIDEHFLGLIHYTCARIFQDKWNKLDEYQDRRMQARYSKETLKLLESSISELEIALETLRENSIDFHEALVEKSKAYRDLAQEWSWRGQVRKREKALQESRHALTKALDLAREVFQSPYREAYTLNAKAWSHYFMGEDSAAWRTAQSIYTLIPADHCLNEKLIPLIEYKSPVDSPYIPYWEVLARIEMLQCHLSLNEAHKNSKTRNAALRKAVQYAARALAYNSLIADKYPAVERAETGLYKRILREAIPIELLHRYARELSQVNSITSTKLQDFLTRMFGPAELWL